ncbi:hypothetical protein CCR75_006680 [Bremia lactucae]|uniref:Uncharacterized protein n=1 Tax=Bremia lactucae TaxID=4779 RepID=A0A976NZP1_BRELC|nr:hypothetical protein CCR75_006680 [Bremia lactucae]
MPPTDLVPRRTKGRPVNYCGKKHSKAATSTQRDPFHFEHVGRRKFHLQFIQASGFSLKGHNKKSSKCLVVSEEEMV